MQELVQFFTIVGLFLWNIKRTDDIRKELMLIRSNDLAHIYEELKEMRKHQCTEEVRWREEEEASKTYSGSGTYL